MPASDEKNRTDREMTYQLTGWILFIVCAMCFIAASWKNDDALTLIGSILFFIACIAFLIPLVRQFKKGKER